MKTPEQKAKELVDRFEHETYFLVKDDLAKQCALIAVYEIIKSNPIIPLQFMLESEALDAANEYWQKVKQEIQKL